MAVTKRPSDVAAGSSGLMDVSGPSDVGAAVPGSGASPLDDPATAHPSTERGTADDTNVLAADEAVPARSALAAAMRGPGMLAVAGVVVNGGSLVMNLVLARVLDAEAYGALAIQISIFMILSMFGSAVQMAVVHRDTATEHGDSRRKRWTWVRRLRSVVAFGVLVTGVVGVVVCRPLASVISYPHPIAIAEAILAAGVWVSLSIERGLLQARGAYGSLARNLAFESCFRIVVVIGLVVAGLGVNGAGLGLVIGLLVGTEHARWASARAPHRLAEAAVPAAAALRPGASRSAFADFPDPDRLTAATGPIPVLSVVRTRPGLSTNTLTALGALVPLSLLQNMDVVIVGALNPDDAGAYAAMSTACKVPVFIGLAVANFLLPEAARKLREGLPARGPLAMALVFVVAPGLMLTAASFVAGEELMSLVFPPELVTGIEGLWVLSLAMTYLAVTLMFTTYLLGAGERRVVAVLSAGTVLTVVGLVAAGGGLMRTSAAGLACQAFNASLVGTVVWLLHRRVTRTAPDHVAGPGVAGPGVAGVELDAVAGYGRAARGTDTGVEGQRTHGHTGRAPDVPQDRRPRDDEALTASA